MHYVRCINNQTYVRMPGEPVNGALADLTIGAVYKVLPTSPHERDTGMIRIIDNLGEDYLYPARYFEPFDWGTLASEGGAGHSCVNGLRNALNSTPNRIVSTLMGGALCRRRYA